MEKVDRGAHANIDVCTIFREAHFEDVAISTKYWIKHKNPISVRVFFELRSGIKFKYIFISLSLNSCSRHFHQITLALDLSYLGSQNLVFCVSLPAIIFCQLTYLHFFFQNVAQFESQLKNFIFYAIESILYTLAKSIMLPLYAATFCVNPIKEVCYL
jgi:hypothetical protein